jgi:hypothetical protein
MWAPLTPSLVLVIALSMGPVRAQTEQAPTAELERRFDASLDAREMAAWMPDHGGRAQPCRLGARQGKCRDGACPIPGLGLGRPY